MKYTTLGTCCRLDNVETGSCIMFSTRNITKIGFVVELSAEERGIIDPTYVNADKQAYPVIYLASGFQNNNIVLFKDARLVPSMTPDFAKFDGHENSKLPRLCI